MTYLAIIRRCTQINKLSEGALKRKKKSTHTNKPPLFCMDNTLLAQAVFLRCRKNNITCKQCIRTTCLPYMKHPDRIKPNVYVEGQQIKDFAYYHYLFFNLSHSLFPKVPQVLRCCSEFVETHGIVDGIYRLSGVSSNIQKLR